MPIIEIISLRLNLDKEEDCKLWDALRKLAEGGKRNEFLKQTLLECLVEGGAAGKPAVRASHRRIKTPASEPAEQSPPKPAEPAAMTESAAPSPPVAPRPGTAQATDNTPTVELNGSDAEAAGLVSQFAM